MPPLPLDLTMQAMLPWLSSRSRAVISALVAANGANERADHMATRLGLRGRFRLARLLRRDGLPPFGELADWINVLLLMWNAESSGQSLLQLARRAETEPATSYRRCKRILGVPWSVARANGFRWAMLRFLSRCRRPSVAVRRGLVEKIGAASPPARSTAPPAGAGVDAGAHSSSTAAEPASRAAGGLVGRIFLGEAPTDVAVSSRGAVYVARAFAATVERLDLKARRSVASIAVGCNPTRLVFDESGRRAYVTNQFSNSISVIDATRDTVEEEIRVPGDPAPLVVAPNQESLYVTTNLDRLFAIRLRTKAVAAVLPLPATSHHLALHPDRRHLYVATRAAGTVLEVDLFTFQIVRSLYVGGSAQAMAVDAKGRELYVANESRGIDVLHLTTGQVAASLRLDAGAYGLRLSPDDARLYVAVAGAGRVLILDRATLRAVRGIETGGVPRHIGFTPDGRTALVVNEAGWVDVLRD
jgi:YVTN family beta-propeller protein